MKPKTKKKITSIVAISIMTLFIGGVIWLAIINDPVIERHYKTDDPNTSLIIREHTKTGQKDYIYGIVDGIGNKDPKN